MEGLVLCGMIILSFDELKNNPKDFITKIFQFIEKLSDLVVKYLVICF